MDRLQVNLGAVELSYAGLQRDWANLSLEWSRSVSIHSTIDVRLTDLRKAANNARRNCAEAAPLNLDMLN